MLRYAVLGSGSSGNSYIFENEGISFLVDAGFSGKELLRRVNDFGFDYRNIRSIFLTHGHKDHSRGAHILSRKLHIPVVHYGRFYPGIMKRLKGMDVSSFPTSHDSPGSVSYSFVLGGKRFTIITDTGIVSKEMAGYAGRSDVLFLEANYNEDMLKAGPYPYYLKQRILSELGHLSNYNAVSFLNELETDTLARVYFCHLSGTNNSPEQLEEDVGMNLRWPGKWKICAKDLPVYGE